MLLSGTKLFQGCSNEEIEQLLQHCRRKRYAKNVEIFGIGGIVTEIGLVMQGSVRIEYHDFFGNKTILNIVHCGEVFAEAYACLPKQPMLVDVVANEDCEVLFIQASRLFQPYDCSAQGKLLQNLVRISAAKNIQLSNRSLHTSAKTIRGRLLSYLSEQQSVQHAASITIPFDRQQLADYLNVDRSALSKELGRMKQEGILDYHKNKFTVKLP